jgi:transposase
MGKYSQERMPYPSDVTDEEWEILEPLIPGEKPGGREPGNCAAGNPQWHLVCAAECVCLAHDAP